MKQGIVYMIIVLVLHSCSNKESEAGESKSFHQKYRITTPSIFSDVEIDSVTLCYSTVTELKSKGFNFNYSNLNNTDPLIKEYKRHGEFFFLDTINKLLVGTFNDSEIINSVWLLPNYEGSVLGTEISLSNYTVAKMLNDFPQFKWSTTGASKYWHYSNSDTTVFYVKVDHSINKFPLNEEHYLHSPIEAVKSELSCWELYGPQYGKADTVSTKPLYAPLDNSHMNYYLLQRESGLHTTIKEITSAGKQTNLKVVRIGEWLNFNPNHTLESSKLYNNGKLMAK